MKQKKLKVRRAQYYLQLFFNMKMADDMCKYSRSLSLKHEKFIMRAHIRGLVILITGWFSIAAICRQLPSEYQYTVLAILWCTLLSFLFYRHLLYRQKSKQYDAESERIHQQILQIYRSIR